MASLMRIIEVVAGEPINIGREGENNATQVRFGIAQWVNTYGEGRVELVCQRQNDTEPYPVAVDRDGNSVVWTVTSADTAQPGRNGRAELRYYVGDTLAKSAISQVIVQDALGEPSETPPEPYQSWVDNVLDAASRAEAAADRAKSVTAIYGETTSAEIEAAYQSEKSIICKAAISKYIPVSDKSTITNRYQPTDTVTIIEAKFDTGMGQYLVTSAKTSNVISLVYGSTFVPGNVAAGDYISEYYVVESFWTNTYEVNGAYVVYTFVKSKVHGVENIFSDLTFAPLSARESATEHYFQGFSSRGNVQIACNADVWSFTEVFPTADVVPGAVSYASAQTLTDAQKAQARANIGAGTSDETEGGTGFPYEIGHGLKVVDNATLEVDAVSDFEGDNTLPITAAAVQTTVGNIEIILSTI